MTNELILYRVSYGKKSTPKKDREYRLEANSPVGTKNEWKKSFPEMKLIFVEKKYSKLKRLS